VHLKEIRLENFKSFAGKVRIPLNEGYTCITGPNGSGKSNITDAILFVLGPKSSKAIRAGKLTELLFNGGKSKSPAKKCQVSLVFDNRDGMIPLEEREVEFTRLVKLSANSQLGYNSYFYVNGSQTTLTRFEELLANAGVSSEGYNLVQQGDITKTVEMGNVERRRVLEGVAGISRFDEEIENSKKQEVNVEANLDRIGIILDELEHQVSGLSQQRDVALKRKTIDDETKRYRALLSFKVVEELESEIASIKEHMQSYESENEAVLKRRQQLSTEIDEARLLMDECEKRLAEKGGDEAKRIKGEMDALHISIARAKESVDLGREREKEIKKEIKTLEIEGGNTLKTLSRAKEDIEKLTSSLKKLTAERDEKSSYVEGVKGKLAKSDGELRGIKKDIIAVKKAMEDASCKRTELQVSRDTLKGKMESLFTDKAALEEAKNYQEFEIKDLKWQISELKKENRQSDKGVKEYLSELETLRESERNLARESHDLESAINTLTRQFNNLKAELDASKMVQSGYSAAVQSILELRDKGTQKGIVGSVAELIKVDQKHEIAIEVASGNRLQAVIVDDDSIAAKCIEHLKKHRLGRVTFLPLKKMLPGRPRGKALMAVKEAEGFAIDLVEFDDIYSSAMWYVFGDTVVVKNLALARQLMGGVRLVTLQGELVEPAGAIVGGTLAKANFKLGKAREEDLEKAGRELRAAVTHSGTVSKELGDVRTKIIEVEKMYRNAMTSGEGHQNKKAGFQSRVKEAQIRLDIIEKELAKNEKDLENSRKNLEKTEGQLKDAQKNAAKLESRFKQLNAEMIESAPAEISQCLREAQDELTRLEREIAKHEAAIDGKIETVTLYEKGSAGTLKRVEELNAQLDRIKNERRAKTEEAERLEKDLKSMMKLTEGIDEEAKLLRKDRDSLYKKKTDLESELENLRVKSDAKRDYFVSLKTELKAKEAALEARVSEIKDVDIDASEKIPSSDKLERFIKLNEAKVESMGPVNMHAIDEYDRVAARMKDLKIQVKKLKDEKKRLGALLDEAIDKKTRGLMEVLNAVNENLNMTYKRLSKGGDASLELENPQEPFAGGLLMKARPPGKKVYRLEALSGGEKSLAALAFIFAIQEYKPSPFYLLDEADANLDALNAESAARIIQTNSNHAQFLQVSHRKVTLKEASDLIGVTMQEKGVSTVIMKVNIHESFLDTVEKRADAETAEA